MTSQKRKPYDIATAVFEKIQNSFPQLEMVYESDPNVDLVMRIPVQPGLSFSVDLNLQNIDELHLCASRFWCEWFPCTKERITERYLESVLGLLSGEFRILEHWRGRRCVKAQLQRPAAGRWNTLASSSTLLSFPWPRKTYKVIRNIADADSGYIDMFNT